MPQSHQQSQFAAEIIAKLQAFGIPEFHARCVPLNSQYMLYRPEWGHVLLGVRRPNRYIVIGFNTPAQNTVTSIGEIKDAGCDPHPFYYPIPPTVEIELAPLWMHLGITYRPATMAEIFQDPHNLVAMSGVCCWGRVRRTLGYVRRTRGAYLLVIHKLIWRDSCVGDIETAIQHPFKTHYGFPQSSTLDFEYLNLASPVSPSVMHIPEVTQALSSGTWPLLVKDGAFDQILVSGGNWQLLPW